LEELDWVAGRILEENLLPADAEVNTARQTLRGR
jgi:hypothetical protein